jgi:hypothetical protein
MMVIIPQREQEQGQREQEQGQKSANVEKRREIPKKFDKNHARSREQGAGTRR